MAERQLSLTQCAADRRGRNVGGNYAANRRANHRRPPAASAATAALKAGGGADLLGELIGSRAAGGRALGMYPSRCSPFACGGSYRASSLAPRSPGAGPEARAGGRHRGVSADPSVPVAHSSPSRPGNVSRASRSPGACASASRRCTGTGNIVTAVLRNGADIHKLVPGRLPNPRHAVGPLRPAAAAAAATGHATGPLPAGELQFHNLCAIPRWISDTARSITVGRNRQRAGCLSWWHRATAQTPACSLGCALTPPPPPPPPPPPTQFTGRPTHSCLHRCSGLPG